MLNTTTANPLLIEIDRQIKDRYMQRCILAEPYQDHNLGYAIATHLAELKELRYQLAMTPERVIHTWGSNDA